MVSATSTPSESSSNASRSQSSLSHVTGMTVSLDAAALDDASVIATFCALIAAQCQRLKWILLNGSSYEDSESHRQSLQSLSATLASLPGLESLRVARQISVESFISAASAAWELATAPAFRSLTVKKRWDAASMMRVVSRCLGLRELTVGKITSRDNLSGQLSLPVLTKLRIKKGWHPEVLTMISHAGASLTHLRLALDDDSDGVDVAETIASHSSLTHLRLALDDDSDGVDVAETIASHCPLVSHLGVCDAKRAFVDALAAACDDGRLRRLRQIAMYHDRRPMRLTDRSFALACVRLLQILSDPSRRLAQVMERLFVLVPPQDFASVEQATDLMLRCNSMLVDIAVQRCMHFTHHQADMQPSHHNEGEGIHAADGRDTAVIAMIREMADNGPRENVVLHDGLLPDVVILPSLRRRLALMSVLKARGVHLPEAVLKGVVAMSGRNARRRMVFVCDEP
ncbi:hypothetical protein P43SY_008518 [Pythium insidiosum]|uniref:Uncharacterized protein n=1 Tax=Pythium insidiosum TaxID=114742 RepID=A0AAD5QAS3_PYTIN|nr:hypothetical protein P43SY_008518 [Pythium insidiosum]